MRVNPSLLQIRNIRQMRCLCRPVPDPHIPIRQLPPASLFPTETYGNWTVHITVTLQFATQVSGPYANVASWKETSNWFEGPTPLGAESSVTASVSATLEPRGTGFNRTVTAVEGLATSFYCYGSLLCFAASGSPRYSAALQIQRPTRPDYMPGYSSSLWFLGCTRALEASS